MGPPAEISLFLMTWPLKLRLPTCSLGGKMRVVSNLRKTFLKVYAKRFIIIFNINAPQHCHTYHKCTTFSLLGHDGLCLFDLSFYKVNEGIVNFLFSVDSPQEIPGFVFGYHVLFDPVIHYPSQNVLLLLQFRTLFLFLDFPSFPLFHPLKVFILNFSYIFEYLSNICFGLGLG